MEPIEIDKVTMPENASPAAQYFVLTELLRAVKSLALQCELLQIDIEDIKKEPVNPYTSATTIEEVDSSYEPIADEWVSPLGWRKYKNMFIDQGHIVRTVAEYEDAHRNINETDTTEENGAVETEPETATIDEETANAQIVE